MRLLVVGEVGDGKSTLINALRDEERSSCAEAGKAARGVTKQVREYVGTPVGGREVLYLDTPGIGDIDVPLQKLFALFEQRLAGAEVDGVLVTTPVSDARVKLGAQVVKFLVENGFVGGAEKWASIVLVGTKNDKADEEDRHCFRSQVVPELFSAAQGATGSYALVGRDDYSQLIDRIARLPSGTLSYRRPSSRAIQAELLPLVGGDDFIIEELPPPPTRQPSVPAGQDPRRWGFLPPPQWPTWAAPRQPAWLPTPLASVTPEERRTARAERSASHRAAVRRESVSPSSSSAAASSSLPSSATSAWSGRVVPTNKQE